MKTIYFLRHGQTMLNKGFQHQGPEAMLSDKGRFQAQQASQRLADESFDIILTSPLIRAKQTADVVSLATGKPVEACAVFEELRRPRELFGKHWLSPQSLSIMSRLYMNAGKDNWLTKGFGVSGTTSGGKDSCGHPSRAHGCSQRTHSA
jgi:broad specificity phosphatase PhoE